MQVRCRENMTSMLKRQVESWVAQAVQALCGSAHAAVLVERPKNPAHGDYATNAALVLAAKLRCPPRELAERLRLQIPPGDILERVEIAGPGFLNFHLQTAAFHAAVTDMLQHPEGCGQHQFGQGRKVLVEFVSANPTGPLHVGHGRGAAHGDILARLLEACGYQVEREYYINDSGRQADILGLSIILRRLEHTACPGPAFPRAAYHGDYVREYAATLPTALDGLLDTLGDWPTPPDPDAADHCLDMLIAHARQGLGATAFERLTRSGTEHILQDIRADLAEMGITMDHWVYESELRRTAQVSRGIERLEQAGQLYHKDGAVWFRSSALGDTKDRVVLRDNGTPTYFAADLAYHLHKYQRGYDHIINIWGADHHGYVRRLQAALQASGVDATRLEIQLMQFVSLCRNRRRVPMSTRQGNYITLRELCREVGPAPARFIYITRNSDQHLDFDLELAKSGSRDNAVYYIQYACARICSILHKAGAVPIPASPAELQAADSPAERALMVELVQYPEIIEAATRQREPQLLASYLQTLAGAFHAYYNLQSVLVDDPAVRRARLYLVQAIRQVLGNGLGLAGIDAPERM